MAAKVTKENGQLVISHLREATTFWQKFRGLMMVKALEEGEGLLIPNCQAVHCCFMRMRIDVIFLDQSGVVVSIVHAMRPWTFSKLVKGADKVLECAAGTAQLYQIKVGHRLVVLSENLEDELTCAK